MLTGIKAVIFDMDGVIIDSEPLWRRAMIKSFTEIGIPFTENDCRITTGLRFKEVIAFWFNKYGITSVSIDAFDETVISQLCILIETEGKPMPGVMQTLTYLKANGYKTGIGTSSSVRLMNTVVHTLKLQAYFDVLCSAELMRYGKPHPEVYLTCAGQLQVNPQECLVIEDSVNGIVAGKSAQMKVLAIPDAENKHNPKFSLADYMLHSMDELLPERAPV